MKFLKCLRPNVLKEWYDFSQKTEQMISLTKLHRSKNCLKLPGCYGPGSLYIDPQYLYGGTEPWTCPDNIPHTNPSLRHYSAVHFVFASFNLFSRPFAVFTRLDTLPVQNHFQPETPLQLGPQKPYVNRTNTISFVQNFSALLEYY